MHDIVCLSCMYKTMKREHEQPNLIPFRVTEMHLMTTMKMKMTMMMMNTTMMMIMNVGDRREDDVITMAVALTMTVTMRKPMTADNDYDD